MKETTKNWISAALDDMRSAEALHAAGQSRGALFHIHLAIEQMLKALICEEKGEAPRSHLLIGLASMIDREIPDDLMLLINELNDVSVLARYPDDIEELRASLTALEIEAYLRKTKELFEWLQQDKRLKQ